MRSFIVFLNSLATNIRYNSDDIFTIVSACAGSAELKCFLISGNNIIPFESVWNKCISEIPKSYSLCKTDVDLLCEFGSQLGKTDIEGQLKHIELYKELFEKQLYNAEDDIIKKSKLYKTMGFFVGTAAALMMI